MPLSMVKPAAAARRIVTAETLNIRDGPDASFAAAGPPLPRGTRVELLEAGSRWSKVEVDGPTDLEGWVNNRFIERVQAKARKRAAPKKKKAADPMSEASAMRQVEPNAVRFTTLWAGDSQFRDTLPERPKKLPLTLVLDTQGITRARYEGRIAPEAWDDVAELLP